MYGEWFYTTDYGIFGHEVKATERSPPDNLTRWIITNVYLVLTSQVQARSSIVGNSAPAADAQQVFKSTFKALINEDYSIGIDIERYQKILSKEYFSVGACIYMHPSDLNLSMGQTKGYNKKNLVRNTDMKIGLNRDINKNHKKLLPPDHDMPKTVIPAA